MKLRRKQQQVVNVADALLARAARPGGNAIAYVDSLGVVDEVRFTTIARDAARWTELLLARGVGRGDRVVVLAGRDRAWRPALLGVLRAGAVAVPWPESSSPSDLRAVATGATAVVSAHARDELGDAQILTPTDLASTTAPAPTEAAPRLDVDDAAVTVGGVTHTHVTLLAQADAGERWLGLREGERVVSTIDDGSVESIWLLLAAWRAGAEIVVFEDDLEPDSQLDALRRIRPAAVWLTREDYVVLATAATPLPVELGSTRALVSDDGTDGATAFQAAFGGTVQLVFGSAATGVVATGAHGIEREADVLAPLHGLRVAALDAEGNELPAREVGELALAPTEEAGEWLRLGALGAATAEGGLRLARGTTRRPVARPSDEAVEAHPPAAAVSLDDRREAKRAEQEREQAEEAALAEEERRREAKAEAHRLREEEKQRQEAERAEERRRAGEAKEAAKAEEQRRRAEESQRKEEQRRQEQEAKERAKAEEQRRRDDDKQRRDEAKRQEQEAKERAKAEEQRRREEEKARKDAHRAEQRRKAEEAKREEQEAKERATADDQRKRDAEKARKEADRAAAEEQRRQSERERQEAKERAKRESERAAAAEKQRSEEAERAAKEAARAEAKRRSEEERGRAEEEKRREEDRKREAKREKQEAKERQKLEERRQREEAKARKAAEQASAKAERREKTNGNGKGRRPEKAAARAEGDGLAPSILSVIGDYGRAGRQAEPEQRDST